MELSNSFFVNSAGLFVYVDLEGKVYEVIGVAPNTAFNVTELRN
jgi:hypothetical protein